jgi:hypothetical protein
MRSLRIAAVLSVASLVVVGASCTSLLGDFNGANGSGGDGGPQNDASLDGTSSDGGDTGTAESGGGEGGGSEGGGGGDGGQDGGAPFSCILASAQKRALTGGDAGTISADNLFVYHASMTGVLALVRTGTAPALAYAFRSDRPGDAPQVTQLQGVSTPANLWSSARSADDTSTYALASDQQGNLVLYQWLDSMNGGATVVSTRAAGAPYETSKIVPTSTGIFYGSAIQGDGVATDFEKPPAAPVFTSSDVISTAVDTGLIDGQRAYRLSDDSVSLIYYGSDMTLHQGIFPAGQATTTNTRQFSTTQMAPLSFQADGANVDISAAVLIGDAGMTFGLFTAVVPEAQVATFNPATTLKQVPLGAGLTAPPCFASFPGGIVLGVPTLSGIDLYVIDPATATILYSATGASNLLNGDTAIVTCGLGLGATVPGQIDLNLIWTDNAGSGTQNLLYAPIVCTP